MKYGLVDTYWQVGAYTCVYRKLIRIDCVTESPKRQRR
jgi:hypothetical protein